MSVTLLDMLGSTLQATYFQVIELAFFFGLCGLSVYFTYGVLDQFISGRVCNPVEIKIPAPKSSESSGSSNKNYSLPLEC